LRLKLDRAAISIEDLASKGPLKPEELRGLKDYDEYVKNEDITTITGLKKMPPRVGPREVEDSTNYRTGWVLGEEMTKMMLDESMKTKLMIHKQQVDNKVCLTKKMMTD
jgi:cilia- and flagella-associated protein 298